LCSRNSRIKGAGFLGVDLIEGIGDTVVAMRLEIGLERARKEFTTRPALLVRELFCRLEERIGKRYCCFHIASITIVIPLVKDVVVVAESNVKRPNALPLSCAAFDSGMAIEIKSAFKNATISLDAKRRQLQRLVIRM